MKQPGTGNYPETFTELDYQPRPQDGKINITGFAWIKSIIVSVLLIVLVGGSAILLGRDKPKPVDWVYINALQEKKNVHLPDGSKIWLMKGSTLAYPSNYGKEYCSLQLRGDAYFERMNNRSTPLSINTINGITTEKGTSFFIRSNDSVQMIIVANGRVRFESSTAKGGFTVLESGQKAELVGNRIIKSAAGNEHYLAWKNERLIFDRTTLKQVAADLYQFYGVPVLIDPQINSGEILITAQFDNQPLARILEMIVAETGLIIKNEKDSVLIIPGTGQQVVNASLTDSANENAGTKRKKKSWWQFWKRG